MAPWCKLDATARYHFKFNRLAGDLKIRRAEARGLFFGLCSWATVHAPDGRLDGFSTDEIEQAMDWQGKPGRCLHAMTQCALIDQGVGYWEIHGYYQNSGTFKEAEKKRKQREISKSVPGHEGDTERGHVPAMSPREEKRREEREEIAPAQDIINEREPDPTTSLALEARYLEVMRKRGGAAVLRIGLDDRSRLDELCLLTSDPRAALDSYLADHRDFYVKCKWKLRFLLENINEHAGVTAKPDAPKAANDDPSVSRREAFKAMSEENKRRQQENEMAAADPKLAQDQARKIMRQLGVELSVDK